MANKRITELPSIAGAELADADLLTLVRVFEVDPTLKNKKLTLLELNNYLQTKYLTLTGGTMTGPITGTLTTETVTGNTALFTVGVFQNLSALDQTFAGSQTISGNFTVLGSGSYASGLSVTGQFNAASGTFTSRISGATITGNTGLFTNITGSTLHITTPSGATPAIVCSGVVSGSTNGFIIKGPLVILP